MLQIFFHNERYDTTFVHDGLAAQRLIDEKRWDFVILDWMLPDMDGASLCHHLRQTRQTPVILLTARDQEQDRIRGLELGTDD